MKKRYAEVIVDIAREELDRPFRYRIPEPLADRVVPGSVVRIYKEPEDPEKIAEQKRKEAEKIKKKEAQKKAREKKTDNKKTTSQKKG